MGLPKSAVHLLLHTARSHPFSGKIATLGRQHVYLTEVELREFAARQQVALQPATVTLHREPDLQRRGYLSDDSLYNLLGFEQSIRIDRSSYEGAEVTLDLNDTQTPESLRDCYDLVLDSGTVEHVFQLPRALMHCLQMAKPGGRIIHLTPSSNCVDHGFYSLSPTLFADFYTASGCEVEQLYLCCLPRQFERRSWQVYNCLQRDRNWGAIGGLAGNAWLTYCVVRKLEGAEPRDPQQAMYREVWEATETPQNSHGENSTTARGLQEPNGTKAAKLLKAIELIPPLHRPATAGIRLWRNLRNGLQAAQRRRRPCPLVGTF